MAKQIATIWFIGLMCLSSLSGFFTVICHGSDGHITVEPVVHNHCECFGTGKTSDQDKFVANAISFSADHDHCTDSTTVSNLAIPSKENIRRSTYKVFTAYLVPKSDSLLALSIIGRFTAQGDSLSSFYAPLRTVILLA